MAKVRQEILILVVPRLVLDYGSKDRRDGEYIYIFMECSNNFLIIDQEGAL
ncbi:hypothetical protein CIPAW_11G048700 [Carya illinoinensis]|uniref:Uncharacterized protein n=1 Tax=Carya illinoinensis TaxID=32201 RepID=A0A8T1NZH9_CARIL|nr:hypothetical protein CIPAW_11G048700 [Carya illinoinensis]